MPDKKPDKPPKELTKNQTEILYALSKKLMISKIAKYRKCSRSSVYDIVNRLMSKGLVEKIGKYYNLTEKGNHTLHSFIGFKGKLRFHNMAIKIKVLESPTNWDLKRNKIVTTSYANKRIDLKNTSYDLISYGQMKVKSTSKSIIFYLPTVYSDNVEDGMKQIMDIFFDSIPKIENLFKVKLIKNNKMNITIISQEIARLQDALAKSYRMEGDKIYFTDERGEIWLISDYSFSTDELETIHPRSAPEDMTAVHRTMNYIKNNPDALKESHKLSVENSQNIGLLTNSVNSLVNLQKGVPVVLNRLEQQIQSHLKLIQEYRKENISWRKEKVKEIKKELKYGRQTKLHEFK